MTGLAKIQTDRSDLEERTEALEGELARLRAEVHRNRREDSVALICFSGEWDRIYAAFTLANGALALGQEVHVFFTFWGTSAMRRRRKTRSRGSWFQRLLGRRLPADASDLPLSKFHLGGLGKANRDLARANARSAELLGELELKNEALDATNLEVARANAHAAELMGEIELKNERIDRLNGTLVSANANASELMGEVELKNERIGRLNEALADRVRDLEEALAHVKRLQGIIPICMHCKRIRDEHEAWHQLERYLQDHSEAELSHGICAECMQVHHPE